MNSLVASFVVLVLAREAGALRLEREPGQELANLSGTINLDDSPNATLARNFLNKSLGANWATLGVAPPSQHSPLLPFGVLPQPTLFRIDEKFDMGGLTGSTYFAWGLGQLVLFNGNSLSRHFGHNRIKAYVGDAETFQMVKTKHVMNPFKYRYSYRVLKPGAQKGWREEDVLFTFNRDMFGRGFFGIKDEWRIYQGRERDGKIVYYCVQSWWGWKTRCWHSKLEYESGRSSLTVTGHPGLKYNPCAILSQVPNAGAFSDSLAPDQYYLFVNGGEDAALMLAFSIMVDSTQDDMESSDV
jgi:hypothetical protein